jgi:hypothetical protein
MITIKLSIEKWQEELKTYLLPFTFEEVVDNFVLEVKRLIEEADSSTASYYAEKLCLMSEDAGWDKEDFIFYFSDNDPSYLEGLCYIESITSNETKAEFLMNKYVTEPFVFKYGGNKYVAEI